MFKESKTKAKAQQELASLTGNYTGPVTHWKYSKNKMHRPFF